MESSPKNEEQSQNQMNPLSSGTQACAYDSPPDNEDDSTARVGDVVMAPYHPISSENQPPTTEQFPLFDDAVMPEDSTEPFPSFDDAAMQENSTKPLFTVSPRDLLYSSRARSRTPSGACNQCERGTGILRCDRGQPACGTCITHQLQCYYPGSQDKPLSFSTDVGPGLVKGPVQSPKESQEYRRLGSIEKALRFVSTTNDTESGVQNVRGIDPLGEDDDSATSERPIKPTRKEFEVIVESTGRRQILTKNLDVDFPVEVSDTFAVSSNAETNVGSRNGPLTALAAKNPALADQNVGKDLGLSGRLAEEFVEPKELLFDMSEEFKFMLHECDSSDVFQLIRDNWHHYSQWVEGAHMKWQSQEYVSASKQLRDKIGASLVKTLRGPLPLLETVLEELDMQLDQSKVVPALQLHEPGNPEWNLLTYFGVVVKSDVDYYLRCLTILSRDEASDINVVSYIYEQIQSRYTVNEGLVR
jgi:hypothetical protein